MEENKIELKNLFASLQAGSVLLFILYSLKHPQNQTCLFYQQK